MKNGLIILLFVGAIAAWKYFGKVKNQFQDYAADTFLGGVVNLRTNEAQLGVTFLKKTLWLNHVYYNWLLSNFKVNEYILDLLPVNEAHDIAHEIIQSNFIIFDNSTVDRLLQMGLSAVNVNVDQPNRAVDAVLRINNQVQALQVVDRYYTLTGKNLGASLAHWIPNELITPIYNHLRNLPTGARLKTTGAMLAKLPSP